MKSPSATRPRKDALTTGNASRSKTTKKRTRIQNLNEERILDAALELFSVYGFRGTTVDQIADAAGMSKPNVLYYFRRKKDLYLALLQRTLEMWLTPLGEIRTDGDPAEELRAYIARKLEFSRKYPEASRLFASEIIQGAPMMKHVLEGRLRDLVQTKAAVIESWIAQGKIVNVDPYHLIFMIWSATQHYADFEAQIESILPEGPRKKTIFEDANTTIDTILLQGLLPR